MGRKIFVSYKYADDQVAPLAGEDDTTARDYVTEFENHIDESDHIYKGESDGEDLSQLTDDTIWEKLKDRIYDSSVTIVFISPGMRDSSKEDRDQWIPWEISYSLKEYSRKNSKGKSIPSKTNAMLAVVLPNKDGDYTYYLTENDCCTSRCTIHHTNKLFTILAKNKFNYTKKKKFDCKDDKEIWTGTCSYIEAVKWCDFINDIDRYIDKAIDRQDNLNDYDITKDVD